MRETSNTGFIFVLFCFLKRKRAEFILPVHKTIYSRFKKQFKKKKKLKFQIGRLHVSIFLTQVRAAGGWTRRAPRRGRSGAAGSPSRVEEPPCPRCGFTRRGERAAKQFQDGHGGAVEAPVLLRAGYRAQAPAPPGKFFLQK